MLVITGSQFTRTKLTYLWMALVLILGNVSSSPSDNDSFHSALSIAICKMTPDTHARQDVTTPRTLETGPL